MAVLSDLKKVEGSTRKPIYAYDWANQIPTDPNTYDWYTGEDNLHLIDLQDVPSDDPGEQYMQAIIRLSSVPIDGANNTDNPRAYHRNVIFRFPKTDCRLLGAGVDLGRTGYKQPLRWNKLVEDYLPIDWFDQAGKKRLEELNQGVFFFGRREMRHSHGPCLLTFSFGRQGDTLNITVNSRTAYFVPVGVFDYTLVQLMAQDMTRRYNFLNNYQITWHLNEFQWRVWTMIPFLENTGLEQRLHPKSWIIRRLPWAREDPQVQEHVENSTYQMFNNWTGPRKESAVTNPIFMPTRLRIFDKDLNPRGMPKADIHRFDGLNPHPDLYLWDADIEWDMIFSPRKGSADSLHGSWILPPNHPAAKGEVEHVDENIS